MHNKHACFKKHCTNLLKKNTFVKSKLKMKNTRYTKCESVSFPYSSSTCTF